MSTMDWWAGTSSYQTGGAGSGAGSGALAANQTASGHSQLSVELNQLEVGMFDPWMQCDDLDLGAILHQASAGHNGVSSESSASSPPSADSSSSSSPRANVCHLSQAAAAAAVAAAAVAAADSGQSQQVTGHLHQQPHDQPLDRSHNQLVGAYPMLGSAHNQPQPTQQHQNQHQQQHQQQQHQQQQQQQQPQQQQQQQQHQHQSQNQNQHSQQLSFAASPVKKSNGAQKVRRCRHITDFVLADEERRLLIKEGYTDFPMNFQSRPLSKNEEKILRKIRRKIRNKKSAQCSRQRKKEYVEDLERKYAAVIRENEELKQLLDKIHQQQQQHQQQQLDNQHQVQFYTSTNQF